MNFIKTISALFCKLTDKAENRALKLEELWSQI